MIVVLTIIEILITLTAIMIVGNDNATDNNTTNAATTATTTPINKYY